MSAIAPAGGTGHSGGLGYLFRPRLDLPDLPREPAGLRGHPFDLAVSRWLRPFLIAILFAPAALLTGMIACEALPATKGLVAEAIGLRTLWIASTAFCLACLVLIYQNETARP